MILYMCCDFFFFKQKTAYEMRISDWSSDVCSSDLKSFSVIAPPRWISRHGARMRMDTPTGHATSRPLKTAQPRTDVVLISAIILGGSTSFRDRSIRKRPIHRSEERRVGEECVSSVDLGGCRNIKKKKKK